MAMSKPLHDCINLSCCIISSTFGDQIKSGWWDSQIESNLNSVWCEDEFKGKNASIFSRVSKCLTKHNVGHFASKSLLNLFLKQRGGEECDNLLFNVPFEGSDKRTQVTKESCP